MSKSQSYSNHNKENKEMPLLPMIYLNIHDVPFSFKILYSKKKHSCIHDDEVKFNQHFHPKNFFYSTFHKTIGKQLPKFVSNSSSL